MENTLYIQYQNIEETINIFNKIKQIDLQKLKDLKIAAITLYCNCIETTKSNPYLTIRLEPVNFINLYNIMEINNYLDRLI